jgi:hypothetical protein
VLLEPLDRPIVEIGEIGSIKDHLPETLFDNLVRRRRELLQAAISEPTSPGCRELP